MVLMSKPILRILQISTADMGGGAEKIANDLFTSYRDLGYQSWLAVGTKKSQDPDIFYITKSSNCFSQIIPSYIYKLPYVVRVGKKIDSLINPAHIFNKLKGCEDFDHPGARNILDQFPELPDILHCHNLHGNYFDLRALPKLSHKIPTVLTLHDAWLLSGHCAHSFDCDRWKIGCGNCPDLSIYPPIRQDATAYNWQRKAQIYGKSRLFVVTPCQWLMDRVENSMLKPGIVASNVIPNGVDLRIFHPADQTESRVELGLPTDAKILLFAAKGIRKNSWKDYKTLQSALAEIAITGKNVLCIALGEKSRPEKIGDVDIKFVPYQGDPYKVAQYYQVADLYVHPSRADTFPTTVLEALACGKPVVGTAVGGIPEQIEDGVTGFLTAQGDAKAMATRIVQLLEDDRLRKRMGMQAADAAKEHFDLKRQANEYLKWYETIIND